MSEMKYVIYVLGGNAYCSLFSKEMVHSIVAKGSKFGKPVSAGSFRVGFRDATVKCWGGSESLDMGSVSERDADIIQRELYGMTYFREQITNDVQPLDRRRL